MKIIVKCSELSFRQSLGLEGYAEVAIRSIAPRVQKLILICTIGDVDTVKRLFGDIDNIEFRIDPISKIRKRHKASRGLLKFILQCVIYFYGHFFQWYEFWRLDRMKADVIFSPAHWRKTFHTRTPQVSTIHAILSDYTSRQIQASDSHVKNSAAIITAWPGPYHDILSRWPEVKDRLFMVPFMTNVCQFGDFSKPDIADDYYFYPACAIPRKNHANLIQAYGIAKQKGVTLPVLVLTGGKRESFGDAIKELKALAEKLGVADRIKFTGFISEDDMKALYAHCKAAISSSHSEAGMAAIQEGASLGKPVACSDIPNARYHAEMYDLKAMFFDKDNPENIADALIEFEKNIDRYAASSRKAQKYIEAINSDYMGDCFVDIFKWVAGKSPKPAWFPFKEVKDNTITA